MSKVIVEYNDLTAIADSIRSQTGETDTYSVGEMAVTIGGIQGSGGFPTIIDVVELSTEDVNDKAFYRLAKCYFICNQNINNNYACYCVKELPEIGDSVLNADSISGNIYYNVSDEIAYGYVDELLSTTMNISVGWHDINLLLQSIGYSGVITSLEDDPCDDKFRLLLKYEIYSYKNGKWDSVEANAKAYTDEKYNNLSEEIANLEIPKVYDWAKAESKPTYTAEEVGALPADTEIPSIEGLATEEYVDEKVNKAKVQSDWNQNDKDALDYIKNKPFYAADSEVGEVIETLQMGMNLIHDLSHVNSSKLTTYFGYDYLINSDGKFQIIVNFELIMGNSSIKTSTTYNKNNTILIDSKNSKYCNSDNCNIYYIIDLNTLTDEYKDKFNTVGVYVEILKEGWATATKNYQSKLIEYVQLSRRYIPATIARTDYVDNKIADLVNSAPETLDTIGELATAFNENKEVVDALNEAITNKANASDLTAHTDDTTIHVTAEEKAAWNSVEAIIDVIALPTEDINEDSFYRLLTAKFVVNKNDVDDFACSCVDGLPEVGTSVTDAEMSVINAYYNIQDGISYGYVDDMLSMGLSVPVGWYDIATLLSTVSIPYGGVVTDLINDATEEETLYLLLEKELYSWNGKWVSYKVIGKIGDVANAEVFNSIKNTAYGKYSHAEGYSDHKVSDYITLSPETTFEEIKTIWDENKFSLAYGDVSHAEGYTTIAYGYYSHAEGCNTRAKGETSHAEGANSYAGGQSSHAEGDSSRAEGWASHTEGWETYAEGKSSHAEGSNSHAEGWASHAEGRSSHAKEDYSHAEGYNTIASAVASHAQGKFNIEDIEKKYAHIVGNGEYNKRSNAHTLDWQGNAEYQGDVLANACGGNSPISLVETANALDNKVTTPTTATVGQVLIVKEVDENGKPIEWNTTDIPNTTNDIKYGENNLLSDLIETYLLNIDYDTHLAFDTNEIIFNTTNTSSVLGKAVLGQMKLG